MLQIDRETHKISEINRYKTTCPKTQILIASSLRKNDYHITRLKHKDFGKSKKWNTFTISRDGKIFQHYDAKYHTDFLGIKEADKQIISIVLENMGWLYQANNKYINWLNEECDNINVLEHNYFGYRFWEKFTEVQMNSLLNLCISICNEFGIPKNAVDFNHYHKDIIKFKGIVFKSNYIEDCSDINPLFNIEEFNKQLIGDN